MARRQALGHICIICSPRLLCFHELSLINELTSPGKSQRRDLSDLSPENIAHLSRSYFIIKAIPKIDLKKAFG